MHPGFTEADEEYRVRKRLPCGSDTAVPTEPDSEPHRVPSSASPRIGSPPRLVVHRVPDRPRIDDDLGNRILLSHRGNLLRGAAASFDGGDPLGAREMVASPLGSFEKSRAVHGLNAIPVPLEGNASDDLEPVGMDPAKRAWLRSAPSVATARNAPPAVTGAGSTVAGGRTSWPLHRRGPTNFG